MTSLYVDSHLRCPRDGKRMLLEVGQDDWSGAGDMRAIHTCWSCGYTEIDKAWSKPLRTAGTMAADRLKRLRLEGTVVPIAYDDSPWPEEDWADADA